MNNGHTTWEAYRGCVCKTCYDIKHDPMSIECQACNADPGETCRPWCIGADSL